MIKKRESIKKIIKIKFNFFILEYLVLRFEFFLVNVELGVFVLFKS